MLSQPTALLHRVGSKALCLVFRPGRTLNAGATAICGFPDQLPCLDYFWEWAKQNLDENAPQSTFDLLAR